MTPIALAQLVITVVIALLVKRQWPGLAWLALVVAADLGAWLLLPAAHPERAGMLPHAAAIILLYSAVRAVRRWRDDDADGRIWALAGWQTGALATFVQLTFMDGVDYTWWNWIVIVPLNAFLAEIWPIYWFILRPLFG